MDCSFLQKWFGFIMDQSKTQTVYPNELPGNNLSREIDKIYLRDVHQLYHGWESYDRILATEMESISAHRLITFAAFSYTQVGVGNKRMSTTRCYRSSFGNSRLRSPNLCSIFESHFSSNPTRTSL